jgi:hypothetical protein
VEVLPAAHVVSFALGKDGNISTCEFERLPILDFYDRITVDHQVAKNQVLRARSNSKYAGLIKLTRCGSTVGLLRRSRQLRVNSRRRLQAVCMGVHHFLLTAGRYSTERVQTAKEQAPRHLASTHLTI